MVAANQQVGEYVLEVQIGQGTFGEVWRARHHVWADQIVAVKIPTDPQYVRDLQREGMAVYSVFNVNIVRAINFDPYSTPPYFVMEYVPGESLRGILRKRKSLSVPETLSILRPVLRGLACAHERGFVHRDMKPENILISADAWDENGVAEWGVKLTDFGLSQKVQISPDSIVFTEDLRIDERRAGTPRYMAPEQAEGGEIDARADLYSCGVILFEMLTGKLPAGIELPSELNPDVPSAIDEVFRQSYARLDRRFTSAEEFLQSLPDEQGNTGDAKEKPRADLEIRLDGNRILIGDDDLAVSFQRTLRIPDDGNVYPLPPGLGRIPIHRIEDYANKVPPKWIEHGGVFITLYQREALWIQFEGDEEAPHAVKVAVGKVNAVTGDPWNQELHSLPQDYLVCPHQPWLDGVNCGDGHIRQFVAMPLGQGYTVEGQVTGREEFGGIQIIAFQLKERIIGGDVAYCSVASKAVSSEREGLNLAIMNQQDLGANCYCDDASSEYEIGLAAGGKVKQQIDHDIFGIETWDTLHFGRVFVHIVNSKMYRKITGNPPPLTVIDAATYTAHGLPWFKYYRENHGRPSLVGQIARRLLGRPQAAPKVAPSGILAKVKSVKQMDEDGGLAKSEGDSTIDIPESQIKNAGNGIHVIRDGKWE